jgi:hypothetical protein
MQNVQLQITFFSSLRINGTVRQKRFRSTNYVFFRLTEQGGEVMNSESLPPVRSVNGRLVTEVTHMWGGGGGGVPTADNTVHSSWQ